MKSYNKITILTVFIVLVNILYQAGYTQKINEYIKSSTKNNLK